MSVERLAAALDDVDIAREPDSWALAAYRLAIARAESASRADDLERDVELLGRAGRILSAERSPIEHARVLIAVGSCRRLQGAPAVAADLFAQAIDLQRHRTAPRELTASLVNLGLALLEAGRPDDAIVALDDALDHWSTAATTLRDGDVDDDEMLRLRGAALLNRAQAHQHRGGSDHLRRAADDYVAAADAFDVASLQRGMALHGLGTVLLEIDGDTSQAIEQFEASLSILTADSFPFQHAVARHSLAIALERRGSRADLARGLDHVEAALSTFDPRLHSGPWRTAAAAIERLAAALGSGTTQQHRADVFVELLADASNDDRARLLRDRLSRVARQPAVRRSGDLDALIGAAVERPDSYGGIVRAMVPVLMDLPDEMLADSCAALATANQGRPDRADLDRMLDEVIHDLLFGPQRVRVRDLLQSHGWVRP